MQIDYIFKKKYGSWSSIHIKKIEVSVLEEFIILFIQFIAKPELSICQTLKFMFIEWISPELQYSKYFTESDSLKSKC